MTAPPFLSHVQERMEGVLDRLLPGPGVAPMPLHRAMRYAVLGGGKRLRAALTHAAGALFGGDPELLDYPAAAVEFIHAYSLVHDDLPAMDDDDLRRGRPSCHIAFDEATAILAGDALQTAAYDALLRCRDAGVADEVVFAMLQELTAAIGSRGMAGGQCIDLLAANGRAMDLPALVDMHAKKTGALIRCSVIVGAQMAGAGATSIDGLRQFGEAAGLCFQIADDLLDVEGTTEALGKPRGSDRRRGVPTFVSMLGVAGAREQAAEARDAALAALEGLGADAGILTNLANYLFERNH